MPAIGSGVQTTVQSIVDRTRNLLLGGTSERLNFLNGAITESTTSIPLQDDAVGISAGSVVEINRETMYVRSVGTNSLTVLRGYQGTSAGSHSTDSVVRVAPIYTTNDIFNAIVDEIASLRGSGLVGYVECEYTFYNEIEMYDTGLAREPSYVYDAWSETGLHTERHIPARVKLLLGRDEDDFPSGSALKVIAGGVDGSPLRVTLACPFGVPTTMSVAVDDESIGITQEVLPVIPYGAAVRLVLSKSSRRLLPDQSHGSRRAEEIGGEAQANYLYRSMLAQHRILVNSALQYQYQKYPPRQTV